MKNFNPIATMKKYKFWIIGLSLLAGIVCFFVLNRQQSYTATAILEYTNEEASQGLAPDGTTIDPSEIYSTEVMKQVFIRMDMDFESFNLDKFRSKVVVEQLLTDEETAIQEALNEKGETMTAVPTKYSVSITLDKNDAAEPQIFVRQLMENMLDVYLSVYGEEHVSGKIQVNDIVTLQESDFDYIEAVEVIDEDVSGIVSSLANSISYGDSFRSAAVGYSLSDLYREFRLIEENDIPNLYAYILNNKITKNADILIAKYQQRIEAYKINNEASLRQIRDIKEIIAAYIDMMRQSGNTDITYEYILDEVYDSYYQDQVHLDQNGDPTWINPDETVEYEVLLESYIEDRRAYEYALIEIAYCEYIIEIYGGTVEAAPVETPVEAAPVETPVETPAETPAETPVETPAEPPAEEGGEPAESEAVTGEPLIPEISITGDAAGAEQQINDLMVKLDDLYTKLATVKTEYNAYSGAANVGLITNIVVAADVQVMLYTLILMIACFVCISALVIFVDRFSDILHYHIYMDRKFHVGNRSACDRYLARHEKRMLSGDTVCIAINVTNLRGKNAEYGRETCDAMIRTLVNLMKRIFPGEPECFMALNGQGQFVVFLEGIRDAQARAYMEYLSREAAGYNAEAACPIEYHYGIAEAEKEDIFQIRNLLVCAVNKANTPAATKN